MTSTQQKFVLIFLISCFLSPLSYSWTWCIRKKFTLEDQNKLATKKEFVVTKCDTQKFKQLIFCWNAHRPSTGYFSFFVQVRDAQTKQWHEMHHMLDWGYDRQQSYFSKGKTNYHHVRLECPSGRWADGFRIKIVAYEGATVALFRALAVTLSDVSSLTFERVCDVENLPSVLIKNVPCYSQKILNHPKAEVMCSPTSCSMVLSYYLQQSHIDVVNFALGVYDTGLDSFGSWPFNIAQAFHYCNGRAYFFVTRLRSFKALYEYLIKNVPVIVSVRGPLAGAAGEYKSGHLLVVTGWDKENRRVICHDPAFATNEEVCVTYEVDDFCRAWMKSHCLAYVMEPLTNHK